MFEVMRITAMVIFRVWFESGLEYTAQYCYKGLVDASILAVRRFEIIMKEVGGGVSFSMFVNDVGLSIWRCIKYSNIYVYLNDKLYYFIKF